MHRRSKMTFAALIGMALRRKAFALQEVRLATALHLQQVQITSFFGCRFLFHPPCCWRVFRKFRRNISIPPVDLGLRSGCGSWFRARDESGHPCLCCKRIRAARSSLISPTFGGAIWAAQLLGAGKLRPCLGDYRTWNGDSETGFCQLSASLVNLST